jgi:hypothetical protein
VPRKRLSSTAAWIVALGVAAMSMCQAAAQQVLFSPHHGVVKYHHHSWPWDYR